MRWTVVLPLVALFLLAGCMNRYGQWNFATKDKERPASAESEINADAVGDTGPFPFYDIRSVTLTVDSARVSFDVMVAGRGISGSGNAAGYFFEFDTDFDDEGNWMISVILMPSADVTRVDMTTGKSTPLRSGLDYQLETQGEMVHFDFRRELLPVTFQWRVLSEVTTASGFLNDFAPDQDADETNWYSHLPPE